MIIIAFIFISSIFVGIKTYKRFKTINYLNEEPENLSYEQPKEFKDDFEFIDNENYDLLKEQKEEAISFDIPKYALGRLEIPEVDIKQDIYKGANQYTLALGVATDIFPEQSFDEGIVLLAGHNSTIYGNYLNSLEDVSKGSKVYIKTKDTLYTYETLDVIYFNQTYLTKDDLNKYPFKFNDDAPKLIIYKCQRNRDDGRILLVATQTEVKS